MTTLTRRPAAELVIRYRDGSEKRLVRPRQATATTSSARGERRRSSVSTLHDACYAAVAQCPPYTASFNSLLEANLPHADMQCSSSDDAFDGDAVALHTTKTTTVADATATPLLDARRLAGLVHQRMHAEHIPLSIDTYNALMRLVVGSGDGFVFALYDELKASATHGGSGATTVTRPQRDDAHDDDNNNDKDDEDGGAAVCLAGTAQPNLDTFRTLFRACERGALYARAFALYRQMRELFALVPDTTMYNALLNDCAAVGDVAQAAYFVREMRAHGVALDASTYNGHLATLLAAAAPYADVLRVFREMADAGVVATNRTYNTVLRAAHAHGDYDRAFQLYEEMKKRGCVPDVTTYNVLLGLCEQRVAYVVHGIRDNNNKNSSNNKDAAVTVATRTPHRLRRTREQRVRGRRALTELVLTLLSEMDALGVAPNTYSYNTAMRTLLRCGDDRVFDVYRRCARDMAATAAAANAADSNNNNNDDDGAAAVSLGAHGVRACTTTYKIMLRACLARRRAERCRDVYAAIRQQQQQQQQQEDDGSSGRRRTAPPLLRLDGELLLLALRACAATASRAWAEQILDDARAAHAHVSTRVYNAYLAVLATVAAPATRTSVDDDDNDNDNDNNNNDNDSARTAAQREAEAQLFARFDEMRLGINEFGARADVQTYNVVLRLCVAQPRLHARARELFAAMCDAYARDVPRANVQTYCIMMDLHATLGDVDAAARLLDDVVSTTSATTTTRSSDDHDHEDEDDDDDDDYCSDDDDDDDEDDGQRVRRDDVVRLYHRLMRMYVTVRDARIVSLFDTLKRRRSGNNDDGERCAAPLLPALDVRCYNLRMAYHLACGATADVLACFAELKVSSTLEPNAASYDVVLRLHSRLGDRRAILALFDDARMHSITLTTTMYNTLFAAFLGTSDDVFVFDVLRDMRANGIVAGEDTLALFIASAAGRRVLGEAVARGLLLPSPSPTTTTGHTMP